MFSFTCQPMGRALNVSKSDRGVIEALLEETERLFTLIESAKAQIASIKTSYNSAWNHMSNYVDLDSVNEAITELENLKTETWVYINQVEVERQGCNDLEYSIRLIIEHHI